MKCGDLMKKSEYQILAIIYQSQVGNARIFINLATNIKNIFNTNQLFYYFCKNLILHL
ncbi:hypothetical protein SRABI04_02576 [Chryseobacterium sp. Bi04]|nr:hypothetical protein SRABI04_02576 [Chryseobacterium sp. Bi04]